MKAMSTGFELHKFALLFRTSSEPCFSPTKHWVRHTSQLFGRTKDFSGCSMTPEEFSPFLALALFLRLPVCVCVCVPRKLCVWGV